MTEEHKQGDGTKNTTGLRRVAKAARYSIQGLKAGWHHEPAFREEILSGFVLLPLAYWLAQSWLQLLLMVAACMLVLITELLNSAVESVVDRVSTEYHLLSGRAKDMASAAVAVSIVLVVATYVAVALDRFAPFTQLSQ